MAIVIIAVVLVVFNSVTGSTPSGLAKAPSAADSSPAGGSMIDIMQGALNGYDAAAAAAGTVNNTGAASGSIPAAVGVTSTAPGAGASSHPRPINTDGGHHAGGPQG